MVCGFVLNNSNFSFNGDFVVFPVFIVNNFLKQCTHCNVVVSAGCSTLCNSWLQLPGLLVPGVLLVQLGMMFVVDYSWL